MAASNVLSAKSLSGIIAQTLPKESSPQINTPYDAVALAVHAALLAVGFRLIGLNEDERLPSDTSTATAPLPAEWAAHSPSSFCFVYAHTQSAMTFVVRVNRMGSKAVVTAMAVGDDKPITFSVTVADFISASSLPASPVTDTTPTEDASTPAAATPLDTPVSESVLKAIQDIFITAGRLSDLANLIRTQLIQKVIPSLQKEGYQSSTDDDHDPSQSYRRPPPAQPSQPRPLHDPLAMPPRNPHPFPSGETPPGWDDEYDVLRGPRPLGDGRSLIGDYGRSDLYPAGLGPRDPFSPFGPMPGATGGMHPSFEDPLFRGQGRGQGRAPPGARWDPTGPEDPFGNGGMGGGANPFGRFGGGDFM